MNIFRYFRDRNRRAAQFIGFPAVVSEPCELDWGEQPRIFEPTHV